MLEQPAADLRSLALLESARHGIEHFGLLLRPGIGRGKPAGSPYAFNRQGKPALIIPSHRLEKRARGARCFPCRTGLKLVFHYRSLSPNLFPS